MGPSRPPGRVFPTIDNGMKGAAIDTGSAPRALAPSPGGQLGEQDVRAILLDCIPQFGTGEWHLRSCRTLEVRKQRRKRILVCEITYQEGTDTASTREVVLIKLYGSDRGGNGHLALRSLWEAGFRAPARHRVPRPYGYSQERGALVQERVGGTPWADTLQVSGGPAAASRAAAEWLRRLQDSGVEGIRRPVSDDVV